MTTNNPKSKLYIYKQEKTSKNLYLLYIRTTFNLRIYIRRIDYTAISYQ